MHGCEHMNNAVICLSIIKGIFSDVHMLALMYAGELCYWSWSLGSDTKRKSSEISGEPKSKATAAGASRKVVSSTDALETKQDEKLAGKDSSPCLVEPSSSDSTCSTTREYLGSTSKATSNEECLDSLMDVHDKGADSGSLEQSVRSVSLEDKHSEAVLTSACSRCGADTSTGRQLFCVMEQGCGREVVTEWNSKFDPLRRGQELLSKFIEVARGPLKPQGWKYDRAVQLLVTMKKSAHVQ